MRRLRSPLLHFLILGLALFGTHRWLGREAPATNGEDRSVVEIDAARVEELRAGFRSQRGREPNRVEHEQMLAAEVDEEILYREALARGLLARDGGVQTRMIQKMLFLEGDARLEQAPELLERAMRLELHRDDVVVRRILVQKMRLLLSTLDPSSRPTLRDLEAVYAQRRAALRQPDRRTLSHVFLSADRRAESLRADALALRRRLLDESIGIEEAIALGDPFPLGHRLRNSSASELDRRFGVRFGQRSFELAVGQWSQPIESAYGLHLVNIERISPGEQPPFASVRDRLRQQLEQERRDQQFAQRLRDLRSRYRVRIDTCIGSPEPGEDPLHGNLNDDRQQKEQG